MKNTIESLSVAFCGLVTSVLVAIANLVIEKILDFDLFSLSVWGIFPIGAILVGLAASSGYYFGSLYFHRRPTVVLMVQMVLIAGFTNLLIYYLQYKTMVVPDGRRVADAIPFLQYLDLVLTSAHYKIGRMQADLGEVGSFGYWLATFQFIGFLIGGAGIYFVLRAKLVCPTCNLYFRPLSKKQKTFNDSKTASAYYDMLFKHDLRSEEFSDLIKTPAKIKRAEHGAIQFNTVLHGCPKCKRQVFEEKAQVFNGREWKDAEELHRRVEIPQEIDLVPIFRA